MSSRLNLPLGTKGSPLQVVTNSFHVSNLPADVFYQYDVVFPGFDKFPGRTACLRIIDRLQLGFPEIFSPRAAYDGRNNLFRVKALKLPNAAATFDVPRGNGKFDRVVLTQVAKINPKTLYDVIRGKAHSSESLMAVALLNVLVNMNPIMRHPSNARSFFTNNSGKNLGHGLELRRGFFQSVRLGMGRIMVNVDIVSAVFYSEGSLLELVKEHMGVKELRELVPKMSDPTDKKLRRLIDFIKNLQVCSTTPSQTPPRWKRIKEVVMVGADNYTFDVEETGESMTVSQYYLKTYNYRVQLGKIICIGIGRAVFPLEVLKVRAGQFYKKTLPPSLTPELLKFATQRPAERANLIEGGRKPLGYDDSDFLRHSGMTIDRRLLRVDGRVLPPPPIHWGETDRPDAPKGGAWNLLGKVLKSPMPVKSWAVVIYDRQPESSKVQDFLSLFVNTCNKLGMVFPNAPPPVIRGRLDYNDQRVRNDMEDAGRQAMQAFPSAKPSFILIIMPPSAPELRILIKNWGDCLRGCVTQCVNIDKLNKMNAQYCANLALKVNVKLGGINSTLHQGSEVTKKLMEHPTMIIGVDVSHAGPGSTHPSVVGFVSSVDDKLARYVAASGLQASRTELIEDMAGYIEGAVRSFWRFWEFHGRDLYPGRIILYRDGVSEGELAAVRDKEVKIIKDTLRRIWMERKVKSPIPKLTFIIVGKRHHVRFFPTDAAGGDKSGNCPAGLIIDKDIVNPVDYDFFLQSHAGLLGTSRPSHYIVLEDENAFGPDMLQGISFALCHVYARATRSVSIPAPVYYADIVAGRGRIHSSLLREGGGSDTGDDAPDLAEHRHNFKAIADGLKRSMYFM